MDRKNRTFNQILRFADPDPGSAAFLIPGSGTGKNPYPGSGMNIQNQISESLKTVLRAKNTVPVLKFFDADPETESGIFFTKDPGSGAEKFGSGIRDKHPESATMQILLHPMT
jgi:hypothetical protein